jgi:hypothetical protein
MWTWLREAHCGLGGHAMILRFEPGRLSLQCMNCGHNTPGWTVRGGERREPSPRAGTHIRWSEA